MAICSSSFCSVRKELIETAGHFVWWIVTMRSGETIRCRLLETWVNMGPTGPYLKIVKDSEPKSKEVLRLDLAEVRNIRPEIE